MEKHDDLSKFYPTIHSMLRDDTVLTVVSTFLQCTQDELREVLLHRNSPLEKTTSEWKGKQIGKGYFHYPKKEKTKVRYITEPIPELRKIQETILHLLQMVEETKKIRSEELELYARTQKFQTTTIIEKNAPHGIKFNESPRRKVSMHLKNKNDYILLWDIKNAFTTLSAEKIRKMLNTFLNEQFLLPPFNRLTHIGQQRALAILTHLLTYDGHLSTGAPSSPFLFHAAMHHVDRQLTHTLQNLPLEWVVYTRYVDDLFISFSRINVPTLVDLSDFHTALEEIARELEKEVEFESVLQIIPLLKKLDIYFNTAEVYQWDAFTKRLITDQLREIRTLLDLIRSLMSINIRDIWQRSVQKVLWREFLDTITHELEQMDRSQSFITRRLNKHIYQTIGALDLYKRRVDVSEANYPVTIESVKADIISVLRKNDRDINERKMRLFHPGSNTLKIALGLWVSRQHSKVTISSKKINQKLKLYRELLEGNDSTPYKLQDKNGDLSLPKLFRSIHGYKMYLQEIKHTLTRKLENTFIDMETMCASMMGMSRAQAYSLLIDPPKHQADEGPVDTRDIPRELAKSNQPWYKDPSEPTEDKLQTRKQNNEYRDPRDDPNYNPDDLPF